jgi:hypothetical protein
MMSLAHPFVRDIFQFHYIASLGLPTKLNKIRGHTKIRGNDLANAAAKLVVTSFEDIPEHQKLTINIGKQAERPPFWVMYTSNPTTPPIPLTTGPHSATLPPPRGGPSRKTKGDAYTPSLKPRIKYALKLEMQLFEVYTTHSATNSSRQKTKGPAQKRSAPHSTPTSANHQRRHIYT